MLKTYLKFATFLTFAPGIRPTSFAPGRRGLIVRDLDSFLHMTMATPPVASSAASPPSHSAAVLASPHTMTSTDCPAAVPLVASSAASAELTASDGKLLDHYFYSGSARSSLHTAYGCGGLPAAPL